MDNSIFDDEDEDDESDGEFENVPKRDSRRGGFVVVNQKETNKKKSLF